MTPMKLHRRMIDRVLSGVLVLGILNACTSMQQRMASRSHARAFITYWPPPENSDKLRLAVKDVIDIKGVVTTAGSEYVARTSQAATKDARCLELARERNVQIVGKTNLTELAVTVSGKNAYFGTPRN